MNTIHCRFMLLAIVIAFTGYANAFNTGDVITFDPGQEVCTIGGIFPNCDLGATAVDAGSYFAIDTNGDGIFQIQERIAISPGSAGGIIVGVLQPAIGSHSGCPDGSEITGPDAPWCFFGNTGMHQTSVNPVVDNGDGTLDFTGWGVTWNAIPNIPLGGDPANFPEDSGTAILTCTSTPCSTADDYTIDYTAHVPVSDPSGFGGIHYQLHMEKLPPGPNVSISIDVAGGLQQECTDTGGSTISMTADVVIPSGDSIQSIDWTLDGVSLSTGVAITEFISLGSHVVNATVTTVSGLTASAVVDLSVVDTTPPAVSSDFISRITNMPIDELRRSNFLHINAEATDICDPSPAVEAMIGAPVEDGDNVIIIQHTGSVRISLTAIDLTVRATDSSNNTATATSSLTIQ